MLNEMDYIIGWCVYMVAACGCLLVFWRMTTSLPWQFFKQCLRLTVAVIVLVPVIVQPTPYYAPAWLASIFELLTGSVEQAVKVFEWIGKWLALSLAAYLLLFLLGYLLFPSRRRRLIHPQWPQNPGQQPAGQQPSGQRNPGQQHKTGNRPANRPANNQTKRR